jgi:hypothetical protein
VRLTVTLAAALVVAGCGISSGHDASPGDANTGPTCVPHDGTYTCLEGSWPACPSGAQTSVPCEYGFQDCMYCYEGAGYICACTDAGPMTGDAGTVLVCVGTGSTCQ